MIFEYSYQISCDPVVLGDMIYLNDTLRNLYSHVDCNDGVSTVFFNQALTQYEHDELNLLMDSYSTDNIIFLTHQGKYESEKKQSEGWQLYQKMFGYINAKGGLGPVDQGSQVYQTYIVPVRNMLKDGCPEYVLRHLVKELTPSGLFDDTTIKYFTLWVRKYAHNYRPTSLTYEQYDAILDLIETEETI